MLLFFSLVVFFIAFVVTIICHELVFVVLLKIISLIRQHSVSCSQQDQSSSHALEPTTKH